MLRATRGGSKRVEWLASLSRHHASGSSNATPLLTSYGGRTLHTPSTTPYRMLDSPRQSCSRQSVVRFINYHRSSSYSTQSGPGLTQGTPETETDSIPPNPSDSSKVTSPEGVRERFQRLGLNANVCRQLTTSHPHIRQPTPAQSALIPALLSPTDVILRAHTGTGKSFGLLLALLSKPRIVFRDTASTAADSAAGSRSKRSRPRTGIASIVLVPSNELASQYLRWARSLFPPSSLPSLDPVIQCLVRGGLPGSDARTPEEELQRLKSNPPHILIGTPGRIMDILNTPAGSSLLGIDTLRTLVLDEADAVLQLPGRFPSHKQRWRHEVHKAPGLLILNTIMKSRATHSGGERHLTAGLENRPGKQRDERRPPENVRRNTYKAAERTRADPQTGLALPKPRTAGVQPLQLVATSATANSVMRHFFGARTGWLRTGAKEHGLAFAPQVGRWIDLTGLSGKSLIDQGIRGLFGLNEQARANGLIESSLEQPASTMPACIAHTCVVVDEAPLSKQLSAVPLRNFEPKLARKKARAAVAASADSNPATVTAGSALSEEGYSIIKPEDEPQEHEMDQTLIEALAFCFASDGVERGLALIPARWSLLKTRAALEALGVSVRLASDASATEAPRENAAGEAPELFLLQSTSSRGLDIPGLSHVFVVGYASVVDAVQYVHAAGRVARIGRESGAPVDGKVVTLLRGLPHATPLPSEAETHGKQSGLGAPKKAISTSEAKMANVYRRLGVVPSKFDLGLLTLRKAEASAPVAAPAATTGPDATASPAAPSSAEEQALDETLSEGKASESGAKEPPQQ